VERHGIAYHEKKLGQLFCDGSSREIVGMLMDECAAAGVRVETQVDPVEITRDTAGLYAVRSEGGTFSARSLVVAAGGLSWPKLGGSDLAYRLARQFGIKIIPPKPGLVPLTFAGEEGRLCEELSGVSLPCRADSRAPGARPFYENLLFTHRGLSGPAVLQISSYLPAGNDAEVRFDLLPDAPADEGWLTNLHASGDRTPLPKVLAARLPARVADAFCRGLDPARPLRQQSVKALAALERTLRQWTLRPAGTEGYPKAEVTVGGIDPRALQSRTMESRDIPGLYFIGEAVDVTGQLGGYNFQWAWASGHAAGDAV